MAAEDKPEASQRSDLDAAKAAARVAVEASKRTGRPVDPRVKELAES
ncbi:hypothetical protein KV112_21775 [Mycolicibacter sp. MYC123]|uniref:Uncharacterized protein n=1 Tax=[Mycobacterium] zoologicum TaxID=2872311 RepID=A0ABU5YQH4_9MYCO|nr:MULTISPECIES: hypothetical protein [unclassified Mycolicibacter]MEB3052325.1 hypothetical protein [Mycolicibacter sp. MYC123]MEB3063999.1 hypothetical protein [Mycolicibacter sp. MYC101]